MSPSDPPRDFADRYAQAWSSRQPVRVAEFFAADGSITINDGDPAVGSAAIAEVAQSYMSAFPDLLVSCDRFVREDGELRWYWTMKGTNTGPGGTGNPIDISGYEAIEFDPAGRIR